MKSKKISDNKKRPANRASVHEVVSHASQQLKSFAFRRPYCTPSGGLVIAKDVATAFDLIHNAYGYTDSEIYDADTMKTYDKYGDKSIPNKERDEISKAVARLSRI